MSSNPTERHSLLHEIVSRKFVFTGVFTVVLFLSLLILSFFGAAPRTLQFARTTLPVASTSPHISGITLAEGQGETPVRIEIPKIGIQTDVNNPASADIQTLDAALLTGAVRYPGSVALGEKGNTLIFGHSSHLPVVHNQAYKAFNDIQNLVAGDPIFVIGKDYVYIYAVETVEKANTTTGEISLTSDISRLTLATCDNFGSKSDRFIVTAKLVNRELLKTP